MADKTEAEILQDSRVVSALCERLNADLVGFEQRQDDWSIVDAVFRSRSSGGFIAVEAKKLLSLELIGQVASVWASGSFETCVALITHTESGRGGSRFDVRFRRDTCPARAKRVADALGFKLLCVRDDMSVAAVGDEEPLHVVRRHSTPSAMGAARAARMNRPSGPLVCDHGRGGAGSMRSEHLMVLRIAEQRGYVTIHDIPDSLISQSRLDRARQRAAARPGASKTPSDRYSMGAAKGAYMLSRFVQGKLTMDGGYLKRDHTINPGGTLAAYVLTDIGRAALEKRAHIVI
jgi:hypothetical protein